MPRPTSRHGVIVHGREDWELELTFGRDLEEMANRLGIIEDNWAQQDSNL